MSDTLRPPGAFEDVEDPLPALPAQRRSPGWARPDPIDELAGHMAEFVAAAVHPDEVAAALESDGLSDDQIRERYGVRDSFALAEELYGRVVRRHPEPAAPPHDPWRIGLLGCLLRGVVFALPGLGYVLAGPLLAGPPGAFGLPAGTVPLLAGALCGWAWNQGLAYRAYTWLGLGDRAAARRALLVGTPAGVLLGSLVALAAAGAARPGAAVVFAAGQSAYLGAATVLLVLGRERLLLAALTPMTAGALTTALHPLPAPARTALLLASLAAVALLALREVTPEAWKGARPWRRGTHRPAGPRGAKAAGPGARETGPSGRAGVPRPASVGRPVAGGRAMTSARPRVLGRFRLRRSTSTSRRAAGTLSYALFGLGSGVLVLYAGLGDTLAGGPSATVAAPAAVALTLSMGPAEWLLHRFRGGTLAGLRAGGSVRAFRRITGGVLVRCLAAYLAALLALTLGTSALWPHPGAAPDAVRLAGLLLLGVVLWTGLLLQSFGAVTGTAVVACAAALAQTIALATHSGTPNRTALLVYGTAAIAQTTLACTRLRRATAHR
ncbi:hypothetical protein AB0912_35375 [Streptomyces sp. NPDC007084]|uniref:hypothetical protein n=1 Tax=Streptomyces sp. NPDC007084 TaxID=3154313 RepID=UPI003451FFC7